VADVDVADQLAWEERRRTGAAIAAALAVAVGLPPALRAMRLDIVNALTGH
jgi:hypothetical protein